MLCPVDQTTLQMTAREGVEIDYCPKCRGVWLDRGELDKIIERSNEQLNAAPVAPPPQPAYGERRDPRYEKEYYEKRKKRSFLGELFD